MEYGFMARLLYSIQCTLFTWNTLYGEIQQWLQAEFDREVKYKTVYKTVRYRLKAKLKIPRPQSIQQDEQAVGLFKKTFPSPY